MLPALRYAFDAVMPVLLQVLLGYYLRQIGLFTREFLRVANRFNFHYCLSALMFCNLYGLEDLEDIDWRLSLFLLAVLAALTLAGLVLARFAARRRDQKGVLAQAAFRSNFAVIGLPLVEALQIPGAAALTAAMQAPAVIYFNFMAVVVLTAFSDTGGRVDLKRLPADIAKNPLIRGLALGLLALAVRALLPRTAEGVPVFSISGSLPWLYGAVSGVSRIATPLALIVLGGQFEFGVVKSLGRELVFGIPARLLGAPAIGFAMAFAAARMGWIVLSPETVGMLIAVLGTPTAVSSAVMAAEMGADDTLAGQLVIWTTIGSVFTLFGIIAWARMAGLL